MNALQLRPLSQQKFKPRPFLLSVEDIVLPKDPKDLSWVDTLIEATEKPQERKRGRPRGSSKRAPRFKTTLPADQSLVYSPLMRSMVNLNFSSKGGLHEGNNKSFQCPRIIQK